MTKYEIWLSSFDTSEQRLYQLERNGDWYLYMVKTPYWQKHFRYYETNYHIWNEVTGEWIVRADYKEAYNIYKCKGEKCL